METQTSNRVILFFCVLSLTMVLFLLGWNAQLQIKANKGEADMQRRADHQSRFNTELLARTKRSLSVRDLSQRGGATYVRWGRTTCPYTNTETVYEGIMTGGVYAGHKGAGTNYLCATSKPNWLKTKAGIQHHGNFLYGSEYESGSGAMDFMFDHRNSHGPLYQHDAPCAVCRSETRTSQIMIPGKTTCEPGWTREYYGYLMGQHYTHNPKEYICVDYAPEVRNGGHHNHNGALLYFIEAICGALPCPKYRGGNEVTCAVCTK